MRRPRRLAGDTSGCEPAIVGPSVRALSCSPCRTFSGRRAKPPGAALHPVDEELRPPRDASRRPRARAPRLRTATLRGPFLGETGARFGQEAPERRLDEREAPHALRRLQRRQQHHAGAVRVADEVHGTRQRVHQRQHVVAVQLVRVALAGRGHRSRPVMAAAHRVRAKARRKRGRNRIPLPLIAERAVHEHHVGAAALRDCGELEHRRASSSRYG